MRCKSTPSKEVSKLGIGILLVFADSFLVIFERKVNTLDSHDISFDQADELLWAIGEDDELMDEKWRFRCELQSIRAYFYH
jgi:hypothetical protein